MIEGTLELLGGFHLTEAGDASLEIRSRKAIGLLAYLALQDARRARRETLAKLLWPTSASPRARANLRQVIYAARDSIPEGLLRSDNQILSLEDDGLRVDVHKFETLAEASNLEKRREAIDRYGGEFLEGIQTDSAPFDDWLARQRRRLHDRAINLLHGLIEEYEQREEPAAAIRAALRLLSLDPARESVHSTLMELYMQRGERGAALQQFQVCRDVLKRQLGVSPSESIRKLHRSIIRGNSRRDEKNRRWDPTSETARKGETDEPDDPNGVDRELPELRQVTVVSLEFEYAEDEDTDPRAGEPERARDAIRAAIELTERSFDACGSTVVRKFGDTLTEVVGLDHARSTDASDAVEATLTVRSALSQSCHEPPVRLYAGGTTGQIMVTDRDNEDRDLVGAPFSRAGRLRGTAAPGEFLVDEELRERIRYRFELSAVERSPRRLQIDNFWDVRRPLDGERSGPASLVGRERELGIIDFILDRTIASDAGCPIFLVGRPGMGKTRLSRAAAQLASRDGWTIHRAEFSSDTIRATDLFTRTLAESLVGLDPTATDRERERAVDRSVDDRLLDEDQRLFAKKLLGLTLGSDAARVYDAMDAELRRRGPAETLSALLEDRAELAPQFVVLEDLHWMSDAGAAVLERLFERTRRTPVVVVATTRPGGNPLGETIDISEIPSVELRLGPLTRDESVELIRQFAPDADRQTRQTYLDRGRGHPLFLKQLAQSGIGGAVPAKVRSLVLSVLDDVPNRQRHVLRTASVLGRQFSDQNLETLLDRPLERPSDLETRLLERNDGAWRFVHDLVREAIYSSLVGEQRNRLHERAADLYGDKPAIRADHLDRAHSERAAAAFLDAARAEIENHRYDQARELLDRGLELAGNRDVRFELQCLKATQLRNLGETDDSAEQFREALELAASSHERARALTGIAASLRILEDYEEALEALERAERHADAAESTELLSEIHYHRGSVCFRRGDMDGCVEQHDQSLELARRADLPRHEARALSGLGDGHYMQGRMSTAHSFFERCIELARRHEFGKIEVANLPMRALTEFFHRESGPAVETLEHAADRAERVGDQRAQLVCLTVLCDILCMRTAWPRLRTHADDALHLADELGAGGFCDIARAFRGLSSAKLDEVSDAQTDFEASLEGVRRNGIEFAGAFVAGLAALGTEDEAKRRNLLERGERWLTSEVIGHNHLWFHPLAMLVRWESGFDGVSREAQRLVEFTGDQSLFWTDFFEDWASVANRDEPSESELDALAQRIQNSDLHLFAGPVQRRLER